MRNAQTTSRASINAHKGGKYVLVTCRWCSAATAGERSRYLQCSLPAQVALRVGMEGLGIIFGQLQTGIPDARQLSVPVSCALQSLHLSIKVQPYLLAPFSNLGSCLQAHIT